LVADYGLIESALAESRQMKKLSTIHDLLQIKKKETKKKDYFTQSSEK